MSQRRRLESELKRTRAELEKARKKIKVHQATFSNIDAMGRIIERLLKDEKTPLVESVMNQEGE